MKLMLLGRSSFYVLSLKGTPYFGFDLVVPKGRSPLTGGG